MILHRCPSLFTVCPPEIYCIHIDAAAKELCLLAILGSGENENDQSKVYAIPSGDFFENDWHRFIDSLEGFLTTLFINSYLLLWFR